MPPANINALGTSVLDSTHERHVTNRRARWNDRHGFLERLWRGLGESDWSVSATGLSASQVDVPRAMWVGEEPLLVVGGASLALFSCAISADGYFAGQSIPDKLRGAQGEGPVSRADLSHCATQTSVTHIVTCFDWIPSRELRLKWSVVLHNLSRRRDKTSTASGAFSAHR